MIEVIGFGLAGACVSLRLLERGQDFRITDDCQPGSTIVAAGLVNPVAGKNFEPSWKVTQYWGEAQPFYQELDPNLFTPLPIHRLWRDEKDRLKFEQKRELLEPWIDRIDHSGVTWKHGGWLDTRAFLKAARQKLASHFSEVGDPRTRIYCTGAKGLMAKAPTGITHRSAKGEILTVRIPRWNESRILTRNGWLIPLGNDLYRVGATYEWDHLDDHPTLAGREKIESILRSFTDLEFTIEEHVAGIRPIINRSRPVIMQEGSDWILNGLGSKGVIYAPGAARELLDQIAP